MAETVTLSPEDLEALAAKLDRLGDQLSDGERKLLIALFDVAGRALAADPPEVEGFLLLPAVQKVRESATRFAPSPSLGSAFLGSVGNTDSGPSESISFNFEEIK